MTCKAKKCLYIKPGHFVCFNIISKAVPSQDRHDRKYKDDKPSKSKLE